MFDKSVTAHDRVRIKICGITNFADAQVAIHSGADALGFNLFRGSKRFVNLKAESDWMNNLPARVTKVAIMVNPSWEELSKAAALPFIDSIQLHGQESAEFCRQVADAGIRFAKALPVDTSGGLEQARYFSTDTILLDCRSKRGFGGTGETFDWDIGRKFVEAHSDLRVIVAGGLTPKNVAAAVRTIRPFAVDVTTGVEESPRRKDPRRVSDFIAAVREG